MTGAYEIRESYRGRLFVTGVNFAYGNFLRRIICPNLLGAGAKTNLNLRPECSCFSLDWHENGNKRLLVLVIYRMHTSYWNWI